MITGWLIFSVQAKKLTLTKYVYFLDWANSNQMTHKLWIKSAVTSKIL